MADRFGRNKWAYWLFVLILAALTLVPSAALLRALQTYRRFLAGAAPATVRPIQVNFLERGRGSGPAGDDNLQFVEFRVRQASAKNVELVGDFNGWKSGSLPMERKAGGTWEIMLPLPPGRYRYLFLADGQTQADPHASSEPGPDGKPVSVRRVP